MHMEKDINRVETSSNSNGMQKVIKTLNRIYAYDSLQWIITLLIASPHYCPTLRKQEQYYLRKWENIWMLTLQHVDKFLYTTQCYVIEDAKTERKFAKH